MSGDDLRARYLGEVEAVTALYRDRAAKRLEARGRELASERAQERATSGMVARDHRGRAVESAPRESKWHTARANGKRSLLLARRSVRKRRWPEAEDHVSRL